MEFRRLFPDQGVVGVEQLTDGLALAERAPAGRPFVAVNMVSTADGKATLAGRTATISTEADRELFHHLRAAADGILVGAGTVRIERYGKVTKTPELEARRDRPAVAVVVSGRLQLPLDLPLLADPDSHVIVITSSDATLEGAAARVDYVREPLPAALDLLREQFGIRSLMCEGGPTLNATLFAEGLVDELFLTLAPAVVGAGESMTIVEGQPLPAVAMLELRTLHEAGGHLFMRYRVG